MRRLCRIAACAVVALGALMALPALRFEAAQERDMATGRAMFLRPPADVRRTPEGRPIEPDEIPIPSVEVKKPENQARLWKARAMEFGVFGCWGVIGAALIYAAWPARREGGQS